MTASLVSLSHIRLQYGRQLVLSDIDLEIKQREITTIIGPNGAGKSCLVKIITGLIPATSGKLVRKPKLKIGYLPQSLSMDNSMPLKVSRFLSLVEPNRDSRNAVLARLAIDHLAPTQMQYLSGGEFQRVLLARAILRKPELLVLDEPLQGVDVNGQVELYRLIASLRAELECAIVMVSHDLHLVMAQTDSVICLNQHVCCQGLPESVSQHPEYLRLFGKTAAADIAIYPHHHDHHHDIHGDVVPPTSSCNHHE